MLQRQLARSLSTLGPRTFSSDSSIYRPAGSIIHGNLAKSLAKAPSRGGQNLSARYVRLEKHIRDKEGISKELEVAGSSVPSSARPQPSNGNFVEMFRGFELPEEPKPPGDNDCCMSGCAVCVYDLYEESTEHYKQSVSTLRTSLSALNIPESDWPHRIQTKGPLSPEGVQERKDASRSAFEELERKLEGKHSETGSHIGPAASKRNQLVYRRELSASDALMEMYEGLRWILFGSR